MTCNFTTEQWLEIFLCHYSKKEQSVEGKQWKGEGKRRRRRREEKGGGKREGDRRAVGSNVWWERKITPVLMSRFSRATLNWIFLCVNRGAMRSCECGCVGAMVCLRRSEGFGELVLSIVGFWEANSGHQGLCSMTYLLGHFPSPHLQFWRKSNQSV